MDDIRVISASGTDETTASPHRADGMVSASVSASGGGSRNRFGWVVTGICIGRVVSTWGLGGWYPHRVNL